MDPFPAIPVHATIIAGMRIVVVRKDDKEQQLLSLERVKDLVKSTPPARPGSVGCQWMPVDGGP